MVTDPKPVLRGQRGQLAKGTAPLNPGGRPAGWRSIALQVAKGDGRRLFEIILEIAEGRPVIPRLKDGREGPPIVPTAADRLRAAVEYAHVLFGRPVPQTEILAAEAASADLAAVRALSDRELEDRARSVLQRGLDALDQRDASRLLESDAVCNPLDSQGNLSATRGGPGGIGKSIDSRGGGAEAISSTSSESQPISTKNIPHAPTSEAAGGDIEAKTQK